MSTLAAAADDYLRVRRALGYKLDRQGRQLLQFIAYLDAVGATTVTIEHAISWATLPAGATGGYWSDRLSVVRQFARYLQTIDPACEVPAKRLLPFGRERPIPFLFTPADIERVMRAARQLRGELHAATTQTLIGVMAVTGIRVGEAIGLGRDDDHASRPVPSGRSLRPGGAGAPGALPPAPQPKRPAQLLRRPRSHGSPALRPRPHPRHPLRGPRHRSPRASAQ